MTSVFSHTSQPKSQNQNLFQWIVGQLNFYRIHLLFFTFTPLIFSGIFYASNGRYKISYVDSLFNCVSAMMVCGLATINLSQLTGFQQALLFFLMCIGNPVVVSWVIVYMRRHFIAKKFEHILEAAAAKKAADIVVEDIKQQQPWPHRFIAFFSGRQLSVIDEEKVPEEAKKGQGGLTRKLRPDMIKRMDDAPKLVNPSGWVSEGRPRSVRKGSVSSIQPQVKPMPTTPSNTPDDSDREKPVSPRLPARQPASTDSINAIRRPRRLSDPGRPSRSDSTSTTKMHRFETVADVTPSPSGSPKRFPRTQTVEFAPAPRRPARLSHMVPEHGILLESPAEFNLSDTAGRRSLYPTPSLGQSLPRHPTLQTHASIRPETSMTRGFGGFPSPFAIVNSVVNRVLPSVGRTLTRTVTMPASVSLTPSHGGVEVGKKQVPYISFEAIVGRNSAFHLLTRDQLEEIGGVEYRALNALLWIVPCYHISIHLIAFTIIAPYMSLKKWGPVLDDEQIKPLNFVWFSAFQVASAYTNTGTSLVDQSMLPFQEAYPMIVTMIFLILAGNTSFPIFLRFMIWCLSKVVRGTSRMHETLQFLLDHPRRCFIYLFPSHQTWFLFTVVLGLTCIDWISFLILDIHNPAISSIAVGVRVLDGFMQAIAVRAAGFAIVPLASLAPAVQVMYVFMMYISVYPIAMSVRSTNVYEEQSLGIFNPDNPDAENEGTFEPSGPRMNVWSRYLAMHARQQLAFDMWWLALSLFVICIIERSNLENPANFGWFNVFRIIFELVSAYGTVGLSLGIPDQNYSFAGAMHTLSKLIVCLVMLRGRHRGLPVAIDRAVMLPAEFQNKQGEQLNDDRSYLSGDGVPNGRPFSYSETTNSRHTPDMRQRTRRASRRTGDEDGYFSHESSRDKENPSVVEEDLTHKDDE
ncbi:hypothetical protein GALMADRAFT_248309 [Galerina marginata CBS 339.88]|uniref:Potassium transport protein n=1 Tax=Galerina marginata (strain CBS 339.88) TaxID=685588 RepID=A0A067SXR4_GALM3|nr:hypothetical protein GALMADRAFT_248309 [Galerina marginata CBS 339.88]